MVHTHEQKTYFSVLRLRWQDQFSFPRQHRFREPRMPCTVFECESLQIPILDRGLQLKQQCMI